MCIRLNSERKSFLNLRQKHLISVDKKKSVSEDAATQTVAAATQDSFLEVPPSEYFKGIQW